jgi:hypothetical protein
MPSQHFIGIRPVAAVDRHATDYEAGCEGREQETQNKLGPRRDGCICSPSPRAGSPNPSARTRTVSARRGRCIDFAEARRNRESIERLMLVR